MTDARVTHVGGPTVLLEVAGWRILTDPTFDPPGRRYSFGWGGSSRKLTGPALGPDAVGAVDVVLLSHDHHGDNLDDAGRAFLERAPVVVSTPSAARRLGGAVRGLRPWETTVVEAPGRPSLEVTATPCRHGPPLSRPVVGEVAGFALRWGDAPRPTVWMTGDTVLYDGVLEAARRLTVDLAIVHVGDVRFPITGPVHYSMTAREAIELCAVLRPRTAIPVHYEGWSHFHEGRPAIEAALADAPPSVRSAFRIVPLGTAIDLPSGPSG